MSFKVRTRKWGNSLGVILPKPIVEATKIKENDEVDLSIETPVLAGALFGKFPHWKKPTQQIKDEAKKGWN